MEADAPEAVAALIATTAAKPDANAAHRAAQEPTPKSHAFRLPALATVGPPPHQETRMVLVACCHPGQ